MSPPGPSGGSQRVDFWKKSLGRIGTGKKPRFAQNARFASSERSGARNDQLRMTNRNIGTCANMLGGGFPS